MPGPDDAALEQAQGVGNPFVLDAIQGDGDHLSRLTLRYLSQVAYFRSKDKPDGCYSKMTLMPKGISGVKR